MDKFDRFHWDPSYTVHDENMDLQHQKIFEITNKLIDKYEAGSEESYEVFKELVIYLMNHFHAEQILMMKLRYPELQKHRDEHQKFVNMVQGFIRLFKKEEEDLSLRIIMYLRDWVVTHMTVSDSSYGHYLKRYGFPQ